MRQFSLHKKQQKAESGNMESYWKEKTNGAKKRLSTQSEKVRLSKRI